MTEILFIRHGETHSNADGRWQGWSDSPLTDAGRLQIAAVARRLTGERGGVAALYSSPLRRAFETAQAIGAALGLSPQILDLLKEVHFGELEGVAFHEVERQYPDLFTQWRDRTDMDFRWPGGERRADFFHRASEACQLILERHPRDKVVVVSHGGTIRACLAQLLPQDMGTWWSYAVDNTSITHVRTTENGVDLLVLNDICHLPVEVGE
jgi:broad specificity phosphatase PhoE